MAQRFMIYNLYVYFEWLWSIAKLIVIYQFGLVLHSQTSLRNLIWEGTIPENKDSHWKFEWKANSTNNNYFIFIFILTNCLVFQRTATNSHLYFVIFVISIVFCCLAPQAPSHLESNQLLHWTWWRKKRSDSATVWICPIACMTFAKAGGWQSVRKTKSDSRQSTTNCDGSNWLNNFYIILILKMLR